MSIYQLTKEVNQIEDELSERMIEANKKLLEIKKNIIDPAKSWIDEQVKWQIEKNSEILNSLTIEELSHFKSEVNGLKNKLYILFDNEFSDSTRYPHNLDLEKEDDSYSSSRYDYIESVFRAVINNLGEILSMFGIISDDLYLHSTWKIFGQNNYRYVTNLGLDKYQEFDAGGYRNVCREISKIKTRLVDKQHALSEANAKDRWRKFVPPKKQSENE